MSLVHLLSHQVLLLQWDLLERHIAGSSPPLGVSFVVKKYVVKRGSSAFPTH